jgi:hypothetical protein
MVDISRQAAYLIIHPTSSSWAISVGYSPHAFGSFSQHPYIHMDMEVGHARLTTWVPRGSQIGELTMRETSNRRQ